MLGMRGCWWIVVYRCQNLLAVDCVVDLETDLDVARDDPRDDIVGGPIS